MGATTDRQWPDSFGIGFQGHGIPKTKTTKAVMHGITKNRSKWKIVECPLELPPKPIVQKKVEVCYSW